MAPDKVIHVEPQYGSGDLLGACGHLELLTDKRNVVLQFHSYFGGGSVDGFTNDGSCANGGTYVWNGFTDFIGTAEQLTNHLSVVKRAAEAAGLPASMGEYGIGAGAPHRDEWIQSMLAAASAAGLSRSGWEYYAPGPFSEVFQGVCP